MEKIMWDYLDTLYPNTYRRETKFGLLTVFGSDENTNVFNVHNRLVAMFCIPKDEATNFIKKWADSKPVMKPIVNSTNPDVLIYM